MRGLGAVLIAQVSFLVWWLCLQRVNNNFAPVSFGVFSIQWRLLRPLCMLGASTTAELPLGCRCQLR